MCNHRLPIPTWDLKTTIWLNQNTWTCQKLQPQAVRLAASTESLSGGCQLHGGVYSSAIGLLSIPRQRHVANGAIRRLGRRDRSCKLSAKKLKTGGVHIIAHMMCTPQVEVQLDSTECFDFKHFKCSKLVVHKSYDATRPAPLDSVKWTGPTRPRARLVVALSKRVSGDFTHYYALVHRR